MTCSKNLVKNIEKDHDRTLNLITQFQGALSSPKKNDAKVTFNNLSKNLMRHFEFEVNYLYPRMRRLILETTNRLCRMQGEITSSIRKSRRCLTKNKMDRNRLSAITNTLDMIANHLKDCAGIISLANRFGKEEEGELNQRFVEFCGLNGSKGGRRRQHV